jgi:urease alpha subunit
MIGKNIVIGIKIETNSGGHRLLTETKMDRSFHFIFMVELINLKLHLLYPEHRPIKFP